MDKRESEELSRTNEFNDPSDHDGETSVEHQLITNIHTNVNMFILRQACLPSEPRPQQRSVLHVGLIRHVRSPAFHGLFLQDGDAADVTEQEPDKERRGHAQVLGAAHHRGGRQPEAEPLNDLPAVVGVSAERPQAALDELPLEEEQEEQQEVSQ